MAGTDQNAPQGDQGKLITVASGKGGVGKTWFAITLAHALAHKGRKCLLFDGDIGLANVDIQLGVTPTHDLGLVMAGKISLRQAITHYPQGGFSILPGRSGTGSLANLPQPRLQRLIGELSQLSSKFDHVILDLGAGIDRVVQTFASHSGHCLLVINDEPTSLTDAYAFIKVSRQSQIAPDIRIVVNNADSSKAGEKTYEKLAKACDNFLKYKPKLAGVIRRDERVRDAIRAQIPLLTRSPQSEAGIDVEMLIQNLDL